MCIPYSSTVAWLKKHAVHTFFVFPSDLASSYRCRTGAYPRDRLAWPPLLRHRRRVRSNVATIIKLILSASVTSLAPLQAALWPRGFLILAPRAAGKFVTVTH